MADEKPFDATPARLARAKREGDVPRSRDVAAAASFACAGLALAAGIAIYELVTEGSSLEEVFLDLTSEEVPQ